MASPKKPVAFVTGSSSFLGSAICWELALNGFDLILHYRTSVIKAKKLGKILEGLGATVHLVRADLRQVAILPRMMEKAIRKMGRLDLLVNNASVFEPTDPKDKGLKGWIETFSVNLHAPYLLSLCASPWLLKSQGCIINMTDIYGEQPVLKHHPGYCASKAGLLNLTKALAREWGPKIRVNAVSPGAIKIPSGYGKVRKGSLIRRSHLRRQGTPEEIAGAVLFMAMNKFINGQVLRVDGGRDF